MKQQFFAIQSWRAVMMMAVAISFLWLLMIGRSNAETAEEKGYRIAKEIEKRDEGWGNTASDLIMVLKNKQGEQSIRQIRTQYLEVKNDGDKAILIFDSPADVRGTVFLSVSHKREDDDQWLYIPAAKRVKRIAADNKGGSFVGSEFSYEDMSSPELEKYHYRYLRDEDYKGRNCFVIERYPKGDKPSLYSKHVVWVDGQAYIPWKTEFYNSRGVLLKTLTYRKYKRYLKRFWRPDEMYMLNHSTGKSTILGWRNIEFQSPKVSERDFTPQALETLAK